MMTLEGFGARLREAREASGRTQEQTAALLGCTLGAYRNWEHDRRLPRGNNLVRLMELFPGLMGRYPWSSLAA
jgi:transcriptional regulator with XRE-family HTH domain